MFSHSPVKQVAQYGGVLHTSIDNRITAVACKEKLRDAWANVGMRPLKGTQLVGRCPLLVEAQIHSKLHRPDATELTVAAHLGTGVHPEDTSAVAASRYASILWRCTRAHDRQLILQFYCAR